MAKKGEKLSEITKHKISLSSIGKPKLKEHRLKIGMAKKGNKNLLGFKFSEESKKKMSESHKNKRFSEETRKKMSKSRSSGKWVWKDGMTKIDKLCRKMPEYKQWRSNIFQRDDWTCQTCGVMGGYLTAHHIRSFHKIIIENNIKYISDARKCKELWNLENGITLCEDCHKLTDNYKGRGKKL